MVLYMRVLRQFSVFPRMYTHILPGKLQKITKNFNVVTKQRQNWNTECIMQFFKIAAYVQAANCMACHIMRLVHFCSYINCLRLAFLYLWGWLIRLFMQSWLVWAFDGVRAWACLTVLCICKCRCKIYYTLWAYV